MCVDLRLLNDELYLPHLKESTVSSYLGYFISLAEQLIRRVAATMAIGYYTLKDVVPGPEQTRGHRPGPRAYHACCGTRLEQCPGGLFMSKSPIIDA
jgi:hypothetical protein